MDTDSILKMLVFFVGLTALMVYIVTLGLPKPQKHKTPTKQLWQAAIKSFLIKKVCAQCGILESQLDAQVMNRIDGAAFKSVKPLLKDQEVYVQLPRLIKKNNGIKDFEIELRFDEIKPFLKSI